MGLKQDLMDNFGHPGQQPCLTFVEQCSNGVNAGTEIIVNEDAHIIEMYSTGDNAHIHDVAYIVSWINAQGYNATLHGHSRHNGISSSVILFANAA